MYLSSDEYGNIHWENKFVPTQTFYKKQIVVTQEMMNEDVVKGHMSFKFEGSYFVPTEDFPILIVDELFAFKDTIASCTVSSEIESYGTYSLAINSKKDALSTFVSNSLTDTSFTLTIPSTITEGQLDITIDNSSKNDFYMNLIQKLQFILDDNDMDFSFHSTKVVTNKFLNQAYKKTFNYNNIIFDLNNEKKKLYKICKDILIEEMIKYEK